MAYFKVLIAVISMWNGLKFELWAEVSPYNLYCVPPSLKVIIYVGIKICENIDHFHIPITHFVCPPNFAYTIVFNFSWERACFQEKLKTIVYAKFRGKRSVLWECGSGQYCRTSICDNLS